MSVSDWLSLGGQKEKEYSWFWSGNQREREEHGIFPSLTWYQRVAAFVILLALGFLCLFASSMLLLRIRAFVKFYTLGNILIVSSTFFLVGPASQCRSLCHPAHFLAFAIYVGAMFGTLYLGLYLQRAGLALIMVGVQFFAAIWYGASYIPYAQTCLWSTSKSLLPLPT